MSLKSNPSKTGDNRDQVNVAAIADANSVKILANKKTNQSSASRDRYSREKAALRQKSKEGIIKAGVLEGSRFVVRHD